MIFTLYAPLASAMIHNLSVMYRWNLSPSRFMDNRSKIIHYVFMNCAAEERLCFFTNSDVPVSSDLFAKFHWSDNITCTMPTSIDCWSLVIDIYILVPINWRLSNFSSSAYTQLSHAHLDSLSYNEIECKSIANFLSSKSARLSSARIDIVIARKCSYYGPEMRGKSVSICHEYRLHRVGNRSVVIDRRKVVEVSIQTGWSGTRLEFV